jgi:hypothetical protein
VWNDDNSHIPSIVCDSAVCCGVLKFGPFKVYTLPLPNIHMNAEDIQASAGVGTVLAGVSVGAAAAASIIDESYTLDDLHRVMAAVRPRIPISMR